ncbi:MAG: hypothetical protein CO108_25790 [Deltaproteobacteria bacterium CG_4_9_14_3_um_filter_63_12]|nr:MAG: hypothetical protein CO108_25790 [Deltaproteobacteria bacterium CG_4_9_14_3_um_filter_63_12]
MRRISLLFSLCVLATSCADEGGGSRIVDATGDVLADNTEVSTSCATDDACPFGQHCEQGACVTGCEPGSSACGAGFICSDSGRCVGVDDCVGVVCTSAPAAECLNGVQAIYEPTGACERGRGCVYPKATISCDSGCAGAVCAECGVASDCAAVAKYCDAGGDAVTPTVECNAGVCGQSEAVLLCEWGCANGLCKPNPCLGVTCDAGQAPTCNGTSTVVYETVGTCVPDGDNATHCDYPVDAAASEVCSATCVNGYCSDNPCSTTTCDSPPPAGCSGDNRQTYPATGICQVQAGSPVCSYPPTSTPCALGCGAGVCFECLSPGDCSATPTVCSGDNRVQTVLSCLDHTCGEQQVSTACPYGCSAGACVNPCQGVTCASAPVAVCANGTSLTTYAPTGTCEVNSTTHAPKCVYTPTTAPCGTGMTCQVDSCIVPPTPNVDWCRLQWPVSAQGDPGDSLDVYAMVYESGVTDGTAYANDPPGAIVAEIGVGPDGSDPATSTAWTWTVGGPNPGFSGDPTSADNDEYMGTITFGAAGTYDYAARLSNGSSVYTFCDLGSSGSADGYAPANAGSLLVYAADPCTAEPLHLGSGRDLHLVGAPLGPDADPWDLHRRGGRALV